MKQLRLLQFIGIVIGIIGIILIAPIIYFDVQRQQALADSAKITIPSVAPTPPPEVISDRPNRVIIPSMGMSLPVLDGAYNAQNGQWTLAERAAHYALPSVLPNNGQGNTLIYGHNNKHVFGKLHTVAPGAVAYVETVKGYRFVYSFASSQAITPGDTSVFLYKGSARLTLQTCSGVYMQNRQMYYFDFVRYEKYN